MKAGEGEGKGRKLGKGRKGQGKEGKLGKGREAGFVQNWKILESL